MQSDDVTAIAHSNIALIKYWGKRAGAPAALNLPAVGSLSITLGGLSTRTSVAWSDGWSADDVELRQHGQPVSGHEAAARRVTAFLDLVRQRAGTKARARVRSDNDFPTGAGLASSASGFAALALAAARAAGLELSLGELSALARCGSGSAARSLFGGFVELARGEAADGSDCIATPILDAAAWPLRVLVAVTSAAQKAVGSTAGMQRTADTSPYYDAWVSSHPVDLVAARAAVEARDFERLAELTESSCLKMHAVMLSAQPGLLYWNPATVAVIEAVRAARAAGVGACFTIDAGPQVKIVCLPGAVPAIRERLAGIEGVLRIIESGLGEGAYVVD